MASSDRPSPWRLRRLVQFRLRSMLILMTVTAVGLAVYRGYAVPYRQQHEAGKALVAKGATLQWRPLQPAWLVKVLSLAIDEVVLQDCVAVHGEYSQIDDKDMPNLRHMPRLERLYLAGTKVTDEGLRHVEGLEHLTRLSLWGTQITDEGLRPVGRLRALEALDIHRVATRFVFGSRARDAKFSLGPLPRAIKGRLTAKCLPHLIDTPELRELFFSFPVDDEGLLYLGRCRHLRLKTLLLRDVTAVGMSQLPAFRDLETLVIEECDLSEEGLRNLAGLPNLFELRLCGDAVSSDVLPQLKTLPRLSELTLDADFDDKAVSCLLEMKSLTQLRRSRGGCRFYLTDAGLADLARLKVVRNADVFDAKAGAGLKGIDVGQRAGVITNEGLTQLWATQYLKNVTLTGEAITDIGPLPGSKTRRMDLFKLVSPRPLSELITHTLETGAKAVTFGPHTLTFRGHKTCYPVHLSFSYTGEAYPLEVLQYAPTVTEVFFAPDRERETAECNWDDLRFAPGLRWFKMSLHRASKLRIDPIGLRRLGEMKGLTQLTCQLSDEVTAEDLAVLGGLQELRQVVLTGSHFDSECLRPLGQLPELQELRIIQPQPQDRGALGVSQLSQLKKLQFIELHGATKEDMHALARITSLREVILKDHQISDEDLGVLTQLPQLQSLRPGGSMSRDRSRNLHKVFSSRVRISGN